MENVSFASDDEIALRRTRSENDLEFPTRPAPTPRVHIPSPAARRSEGHSPRSTIRHADEQMMYELLMSSNSRPIPPSRMMADGPGGRHHHIHHPRVPSPIPPPWDSPTRPFDDLPTIPSPSRRPTQPPERTGWVGSTMRFFGYTGQESRSRRELASLMWNLAFAAVQFVTIVTLLAYSSNHKSPIEPTLSEWHACGKPLGVWNSLWIVRVALGATVSYWGWSRDRTLRIAWENRERGRDAEAGQFSLNGTNPTVNTATSPIAPPPSPFSPRTPASARSPGSRTPGSFTSAPLTENQLPYTALYSRLSLLTSVLSLVWFLTAHILEYTSVNTCRHSAPHLWWLTFGILCILYLMILEIFLLGLLVFILGPVLYLIWNIVLLCLGRHPLQNPHFIKPEIGKLSKSLVDQIPLVLYIPAPPEEEKGGKTSTTDSNGVTVPKPIYTYPPKPSASATRKKRFAFFRKFKKGSDKNGNGGSDGKGGEKGKGKAAHEIKTWEDHWEAGDYPFVRLEGNRAACAICLMDFEEPKRVDGAEPPLPKNEDPDQHKDDEKKEKGEEEGEKETDGMSPSGSRTTEIQVDEVTEEDRERLKLEDAGEGAQPLRLLECGHVFHKTCIDPWLTDVSGRCPVCQRPVEFNDQSGKKKKRRGNNNNNNDSNSRTNSNPPTP